VAAGIAGEEKEMTLINYLFAFLIFPGFLFAACVGLLAGWVDRKVTAKLQWRVGPPWYQNFMDIAKLFYKETLAPEGCSRAMFFGMPLLALVGASLLVTIVLMVNLSPKAGFIGDFIVVLYLAMLPSVALMFAGSSSANPLASLGASREMKLILSYELPFIMVSAVSIIKAGYTISFVDILRFQQIHGAFITSASGFIAFVVAILVIQAKLGFAPFDMAEAETEKFLALWKLTKAILTVALPVLVITVLFGGFGTGWSGLGQGILKYVLVLVLTILIKNTNPRVRIDQALRFFWGPVAGLAVISVLLAVVGK
jgi:NADH-quinone oxidoreductase subunit H